MNLNWSRQKQSKNYQGEERQGFTLTYIDHLNCLLMFGGTHSKACEIYLYDLANKKWEIRKIVNPKPVPRKFHTAYYDKSIHALIVYGGQADKGRSLEGFDVLFLNQWKWKRLLIKNPPPPRQFHTFTPIEGGNFLIFGGITLPYGTFLDDLWVLKKVRSLKQMQTLEIPGCSCSQLATKGQMPTGRYAHRAFATKNTFFIIGGESDQPEDAFTIYSLNLSNMCWKKHHFNINLQQLVGFSLLRNPNSVSENEVLIFGGILSKSKKGNRYVYGLELSSNPACKKLEKVPDIPTQILNNCYECGDFAICCSFSSPQQLTMYRCNFASTPENLSLQQYLKFIKNQQIISQQLISKVKTLQTLHRQIQGFISTLYHKYQESDGVDGIIEQQKKQQIESCMNLKNEYEEIDLIYDQNLISMKQARKQLAQINEYFEECIETERDQDINN